MKNKRTFSSLQRKRQLHRQQNKMTNRRQEFFNQRLIQTKEVD